MRPFNTAFRTFDRRAWALLALLALVVVPARGEDVDVRLAAHAAIGCGECHGAAATTRSLQAADDRLSARCADCHDRRRTAGAAVNPFHQDDGKSCVACHSFHDPAVVRAGDREFSLQPGNERVRGHCRACHVAGVEVAQLVGGHRFAAEAVYHNDGFDLAELSPSDACLLCHDRANAALAMPPDLEPAPRFHTEASHPVGEPVHSSPGASAARIRPDLDPRIPLPGGNIECQTCHLVTAATRKLLLPFDDPYSLCLGCHQLRQPLPGDAGKLAVAAASTRVAASRASR